MTPEKYQHSIELSYRENDPLIHPNAIQIGTMTTIYYNNNAYVSILTGYRNESGCAHTAVWLHPIRAYQKTNTREKEGCK